MKRYRPRHLPLAYAVLGVTLDSQGRFDEALENYRRHVELAGDAALPFVLERIQALEAQGFRD